MNEHIYISERKVLTLIWFFSCSASWRNWSSSLIFLF